MVVAEVCGGCGEGVANPLKSLRAEVCGGCGEGGRKSLKSLRRSAEVETPSYGGVGAWRATPRVEEKFPGCNSRG